MHRYYVHALESILEHQTIYDVYQVRHPFPPYATHYLLLLGLSHLVAFDTAEKIFVCITFLCFALGLRLAARAVGPAGEWTSLFFAPLLFSWAMMMGFFNYVLGVGLLLLAVGFWQQVRNGNRVSLVWYLLTLAVLTFTHPVPLLLLIAITLIDLGLSYLFRQRALGAGSWIRREAPRVLLLVCTLAAFGFPALAVDNSAKNNAKMAEETHLKWEFVRTSLLLHGVFPYNTRSRSFWINGERLCLYVMLVAALWFGGKATLAALRERRPTLGCTLFFSLLILAFALPIVPNSVNGSFYFATRLVLVLWPAALIAAAAAPAPEPARRPLLVAGALVSALCTLVAAQIYLRPIAATLHAAEYTPIPTGQHGLVLLGENLPEYMRYGKELAFNPFQWGGVLPMVQSNDVVLDSPWLDQKIAPLEARPGSPILLDDVAGTADSKDDPPAKKGHSLPGKHEAEMVDRSSFVVLVGAPKELTHGLSGQLFPREAAKFTCSQPQYWFLVCRDGRL